MFAVSGGSLASSSHLTLMVENTELATPCPEENGDIQGYGFSPGLVPKIPKIQVRLFLPTRQS